MKKKERENETDGKWRGKGQRWEEESYSFQIKERKENADQVYDN